MYAGVHVTLRHSGWQQALFRLYT